MSYQQVTHLRGDALPSAGASASNTATAPSPRAAAARRPIARGASMGPAAIACTIGGLKICRQSRVQTTPQFRTF